MADHTNSTVYVGNLDERVSDRVLYDILIQAGPVVDLYIPRDKETEKPKGFAFAQYESEEIAAYAVKLFSGLVVLYNKTLKFAISGQDKPLANSPAPSSSHRQRPHSSSYSEMGVSLNSTKPSLPSRFSEHHVYSSQERDTRDMSFHHRSGYRSNYEHSSGHRLDYEDKYEHPNGYRSYHENDHYENSNGNRSHYGNYHYDNSRRVL